MLIQTLRPKLSRDIEHETHHPLPPAPAHPLPPAARGTKFLIASESQLLFGSSAKQSV